MIKRVCKLLNFCQKLYFVLRSKFLSNICSISMYIQSCLRCYYLVFSPRPPPLPTPPRHNSFIGRSNGRNLRFIMFKINIILSYLQFSMGKEISTARLFASYRFYVSIKYFYFKLIFLWHIFLIGSVKQVRTKFGFINIFSFGVAFHLLILYIINYLIILIYNNKYTTYKYKILIEIN